MYIKHFGLNILPFENVPDPAFFFDKGDYKRIFMEMVEFLKTERGLMVVAGPIGSGKTTLSQVLMSYIGDKMKVVWLAEPPERSIELLSYIARELGLESSSSASKVFLIKDIREFLLKSNREGKRFLIIIDEAHQLSDEVIGGVRLLNNLEEGADKLFQIILIGQDELMDIISKPELTSFKQRITNLELIGRMDKDRIHEYILHRLHVAGASEENIFSDTGIGAVAAATGGVPRLINTLCHRAMIEAFKRKKYLVDMDDVDEAAQEIGLGRETFRYITKTRFKEKEKQVAFHKSVQKSDLSPLMQKNDSPLPEQNKKHIPLKTKKIPLRLHIGHRILKRIEGMEMPILFLLSSIVAFVLSIMFYCGKLGSSSSITCIWELLN